jgi:peptidoglycan/xylan/chitin deacetylase (PgdA/CDA1 family)
MEKNLIITTSWDDGHKLDLRMADLLDKYDLPGTFYIPNNCQLTEEEIKGLYERGFEIGGHTVSHPNDMKLLTAEECKKEVGDNKQWLEKTINDKLRLFCYPKGRYSEETMKIVKECGYVRARTVLVMNTDIPKDNMRVNPTIHVYPNRKEYKGFDWLKVAKQQFINAQEKRNGYYHVWGHSEEVNRFNLWDQLEELFKFIRNEQSNRNNNNTN